MMSHQKISGLVVNVANPALILSAGINQKSSLRGRQLFDRLPGCWYIFIAYNSFYYCYKILRADKKMRDCMG